MKRSMNTLLCWLAVPAHHVSLQMVLPPATQVTERCARVILQLISPYQSVCAYSALLLVGITISGRSAFPRLAMNPYVEMSAQLSLCPSVARELDIVANMLHFEPHLGSTLPHLPLEI